MKRYVIIDFLHLAHRCIKLPKLSASVMCNGEMIEVDTTIANSAIKNVWRYSGKGLYPTAVCLDGGSWRKSYFANGFQALDGTQTSASNYKANRENKGNPFFAGVDTAITLMKNGKVSLYRKQGMEADDLLYSLVRKIKEIDTETPIDVITNDSDILPLVDNQVSVYIRGTREFNIEGCPIVKGYFQVTPETWDDYISYSSYYKDFKLPYNSILLYKIIRGDTSDTVPMAVKGYGAKKFTALLDSLKADGCDFSTVFRYGKNFDTEISPWLSKYFNADELKRIKFVYEGINLQYINTVQMPQLIVEAYLQRALDGVGINLVRS